MYDYEKIREYYHALIQLQDVFNSSTSGMVQGNLVLEYERYLERANKDLPGLLNPFDKNDYFSHTNGPNSNYYHAEGIKANIGLNLGILKVKKDKNNETPFTEVKNFTFIKEDSLRKILERDYVEIQRSMISDNWKSAIILSGGSIEALILDLLNENLSVVIESEKAPKGNLDRWDLNDLIEVAVDTKLVDQEVAKLSHSVREYRNLIHPGVEIRSKLKVEPEEAKIAVQVLNILIRELSK